MGGERGSGRESAALAARVVEIARDVERARFGGSNPVVEVPADASAFEIVARTLAAERLNARLRIDDREYNPGEDFAVDTVERALVAFRAWSFASGQARLDAAAERTTDPALQQRIGVWKLLGRLVERLVITDPDTDLAASHQRRTLEQVQAADQLGEAERDHYRAEMRRVVAEHTAARDQPLSRVLWYVLRARLALAAGEPVLALAWCVRAAGVAEALPNGPRPDEYLAGLLVRARSYVLLAMGTLSADEVAAAREGAKDLQAWDVYHALVAYLSRLFGTDVHRETARFSIAPYVETDE